MLFSAGRFVKRPYGRNGLFSQPKNHTIYIN